MFKKAFTISWKSLTFLNQVQSSLLQRENNDNTCWTRITVKIQKSDHIHSAISLSDLCISLFFQISYQVFSFFLLNASRDHFCSRAVFLRIHQVLHQHLSPGDAFVLVASVWSEVKWSEVAQSCPILCNPVDCSLPGSWSMGFSRQEYWSGLPFPSPGDIPNPGIKPGSPAL